MPKLTSTLRPRTIDIKDVICDIEAKYLTEQETKKTKNDPQQNKQSGSSGDVWYATEEYCTLKKISKWINSLLYITPLNLMIQLGCMCTYLIMPVLKSNCFERAIFCVDLQISQRQNTLLHVTALVASIICKSLVLHV